MSETEEKNTNTFRRDSVKPYVELIDDGREYYAEDELQDLSLSLQCNSKGGVVLYGPTGCGKTALVRKFIQQDLKELFGVESIKVFHIRPFWTIGRFDIETMLNIISNIVEESETKAVILHAEFSSLDLLNQALNVMDYYLDGIVNHFNLNMIKFIFELRISKDPENNKEILKKLQDSSRCMSCEFDIILERYLGIITLIVDELSKKYEISYSKNDLLYFIASFYAFGGDIKDINECIDFFEKLFVLSKFDQKISLDRKIAGKVFPYIARYFEENSKEVIRSVAIHESGHALIGLLNEKDGKIIFASIIPGYEYNGVVVREGRKQTHSCYCNKDFYVKSIARCLAGRIAQQAFDKNAMPDFGAVGDLGSAMMEINRVITRMGISEEIGKNYVLSEKDHFVSEETVLNVEDARRQLLKDAEEYAERMISIHKEFVEQLADKLMEEGVVAQDELYEMWETYLKSKQ
ncbi:MAG: hypothetical protein IKN09_00750 [Clostridia bacterium]|nr:hypothetical protein [Clostridia bacterium]MBR4261456.1 hypothetical protein [Clostridia bacterium]